MILAIVMIFVCFYSCVDLKQTKISSMYKKLDKKTSERYTNAISY